MGEYIKRKWGAWMEKGEIGEEEEEEVECLSPGSESGSQSGNEFVRRKENLFRGLRLLIREGSSMSYVDRELILVEVEEIIDSMVKGGRRDGYKEAESIQAKHIADLEYLLDKEEEWRKALEEESKGRGQEMRGIVREEMERVLKEWEEKRGGRIERR